MNEDPYPEPGRRLRVTLGRDVKIQRVEWWEPDFLPIGMLTLLAGREGLGKSTIATSWCARETQAGNHILYLHSEDSREHTVAPRLQAAGADMSKVLFVDVETETTDTGTVILPYDTDQLDRLLAEYAVTFVVLDAATSAMSSHLSGKDDRQVRQFLEPLSQLAAKHNAVVLGLVHFGKREGADSGKLILGSIAWSQVARSVLSVAADPDSGHLVITNTKGNLAPRTRSTAARIASTTIMIDYRPAEIGVLEWLGDVDTDARDLLGADQSSDRESRNEAEDWIEDYLTEHDSVPSAEVKRECTKALGVSERTIKRAAKALNVRSESRGFPRQSFWSLPTVVDGEVVDSGATTEPHARNRGPTGPTGLDQQKRSGPTGQNSQSGHALVSGPTGGPTGSEPPGAPTSSTPGMTTKVAEILANQRSQFPVCESCGRRVAGHGVTRCAGCANDDRSAS